jgi:hypothetical protein
VTFAAFGYASATLWTRFQWLAIARLALHVASGNHDAARAAVAPFGCFSFLGLLKKLAQ